MITKHNAPIVIDDIIQTFQELQKETEKVEILKRQAYKLLMDFEEARRADGIERMVSIQVTGEAYKIFRLVNEQLKNIADDVYPCDP